ncbi:NAD(P)-dependent oxidoreductase [Georgenia sp. SUBG003]|uniref:NAD(P)-dependent oxidoreductase n=1 Tax=Georgenia sp. SUBG003 TaxID=1497974 RepID=UPI0004D8ECD2|nr:2-hydroxy-3-oxopropionate reductase [Georgenia sp. SUBG003]
MELGTTRLGFIGLGLMGQPMALNLLRAGARLTVWNRTAGRCVPVLAAGAHGAADPAAVLAASDAVILMLADETAVDDVLARGTPGFARRVAGKLLIHMGTVTPAYSRGLEAEIVEAGGHYVEAPVSGSRGPAQTGDLVVMLAGTDVDAVAELVRPVCREVVRCGPVPGALLMKLAVNHFLITMVTGLAEAFAAAEQHGLDTALLAGIIEAGPMASRVSRAKARKLVEADFAVEAPIADVARNARLIVEAAGEQGIDFPLISACLALYDTALRRGDGGLDMAAVVPGAGRR